MNSKRKPVIWWILASGVAVVLLIMAITLIFKNGNSDDDLNSGDYQKDCPYCKNSTSKLGELCSKSEMFEYKKYAVSTDSNVCANTGRSILDEGGNAVDAAISVLLCMGVTIPESMGLGGGSLIVIYNKTEDRAIMVNAREIAPRASFRDMYNSSSSLPNGSSLGVQSIAVPGELAGYWHMFNKYGSKKITWERLFKDAIDFAENGFPVGVHLQDAMEQKRHYIMENSLLKKWYVNPKRNDLYKAGDILKQPILAETLRNISKSSNGHDYFYTVVAKKIMHDLENHPDFKNQKPYITLDDFKDYKVIETEAYKTTIKGNLTLHTAKLPGSGYLLSFILKTMLHPRFKDLYPDAKFNQTKAELFYHRLMETFKFAYAQRMHLGDDRFDNVKNEVNKLLSDKFIDLVANKIDDKMTHESKGDFYDVDSFQELDHGTAHLSVLDADGNAVSASTTVNLYFGSKVMSPSTGLIMNDEMDDFNIGKTNSFDIPISYSNSIQPGKHPLSSMSPSVFIDDTGVRLIIGASGGSKITTAVSLVALRHLFFNDTIKMAIDSARLHHQLFPINVENEECFPKSILESLKKRKHVVEQLKHGVRGAIVMAISRDRNGIIRANSDYRKGGTISGV